MILLREKKKFEIFLVSVDIVTKDNMVYLKLALAIQGDLNISNIDMPFDIQRQFIQTFQKKCRHHHKTMKFLQQQTVNNSVITNMLKIISCFYHDFMIPLLCLVP